MPRNSIKHLLRVSSATISTALSYLSTLSGLAAYWPLDDANAFSRVINPAVALGRNLVINGDFATDTIWTKGTGWTIAAGVAHSDGTSASLTESLPVVVGKSYEMTFTILNYVSGSLRPLVGGSGIGTSRSANGTYTETIVCVGSSTCGLNNNGAFIGDIDNVTIKQVNILASTSYSSAELLTDGNMETAGVAAWTAVASATLTKEVSSPHGGTQNLKVKRNGFNNPKAQQAGLFAAGKRYRVSGWVKGDGTANPIIQDTNSVTIFTGTTSTSWQAFDVLFIPTAAGGISLFVNGSVSDVSFCEFDDFSVTEVNPLTGVDSGPTAGVSAGSRLLVAKSFDGVNDFINVYSADLNSVFTPDAGTLLAFAKVSAAGVWTDATVRNLVILGVDTTTNYVRIFKSATDNTIEFRYSAASTLKTVTTTTLAGNVGWNMLALTWDKVADQVKAYVNGVQVGVQTALGTWAGNLSTTNSVIGAQTTAGLQPFSGLLAHPLLASRALTAAEILAIAQAGGVA